ncbi:N-acetyltransferase [Acidovorax sp. CCYZU-2555]|nr:GNAT family N-acetyltransferase [Acidovorax sp. CCYZU-2555]MBS7779453.1 N-acetyltransferase [Acidovorax sp. CCYZU-2555]
MDFSHHPNARPGPLIVDAGSEHVAAIQQIYAHYVQNSICTMEEVAPTVAEMHRRHDALRREGLPWLVALDGTDVLGYAYAGRYRSRVGYAGTLETSIYLGNKHQGRGLGQALLRALIEACAQFGARQMVAVIVDDEGTVGSVRLHQRFGFQHAGLFCAVGSKFGRDVDTILMQRSLVAP